MANKKRNNVQQLSEELNEENVIVNIDNDDTKSLVEENKVITSENITEESVEVKNSDSTLFVEEKKETKDKENFKNIFKYKNGKYIKYKEDSNFKAEMNKIAKERGYYEDIFKSNIF